MSRHVPPEELIAFADGEMEAADAARVRSHLDSCQECREGMSNVSELGALVNRGFVASAESSGDDVPETAAAAIDASLRRLLPAADAPPERSVRSLRRVTVLVAALAAALLVAVSLPFVRRPHATIESAALSAYATDVLVRGTSERRFFLDVKLGAPSFLCLLAVDPQGRAAFLLPHEVFGDFGLTMPLPVAQTVRIPPAKLQDFAEDEVRDRLLVLVPSPHAFTDADRSALGKLAAGTAAAARGESVDQLRARLETALATSYPGSRVVLAEATDTKPAR
jgi:Putative zinc-finger